MLQQLSSWTRWHNAGGVTFYDATFAGSIGGYPRFAMLASTLAYGSFWISTVDNNTGNPDSGAPNWISFPPAAGVNVSSFNGRTGAVTLSNGDVVGALGSGGLPLYTIATAPAQTLLGNLGGSPGAPAWTAMSSVAAAVLSALGASANLVQSSGHIVLPIYSGGTIYHFYFQWGEYHSSITNESQRTVNWDTPFPNACLKTWAINWNPGASTLQDMWLQVVNYNTSQGTFIMQGTSTGVTISGFDYFAIGY